VSSFFIRHRLPFVVFSNKYNARSRSGTADRPEEQTVRTAGMRASLTRIPRGLRSRDS